MCLALKRLKYGTKFDPLRYYADSHSPNKCTFSNAINLKNGDSQIPLVGRPILNALVENPEKILNYSSIWENMLILSVFFTNFGEKVRFFLIISPNVELE